MFISQRMDIYLKIFVPVNTQSQVVCQVQRNRVGNPFCITEIGGVQSNICTTGVNKLRHAHLYHHKGDV